MAKDINTLSLFGRKLRLLRKERNLTQTVLGKELGTTREMIAYFEMQCSNPTIDVVRKLADFFQISSDYFLYEDEEVNRPGPKSTLERQIEDLRDLPPAKRKLASDLLETVLKNAQS